MMIDAEHCAQIDIWPLLTQKLSPYILLYHVVEIDSFIFLMPAKL